MSADPPPVVEHELIVPRTARYAAVGGGAHVSELCFVLHGYGELAAPFLENFRALATARRRIVAPEGLSRFYLRGTGGDVGASWMTRIARETEITDQGLFLDAVRHEVGHAHAAARLRVLGFSQGTATACRWVARGTFAVERLVLWGGGVPPDLGPKELARLRDIELVLVVGDRDRFLYDGALARELEHLRRSNLTARIVRFAGGHELHAATLADVLA